MQNGLLLNQTNADHEEPDLHGIGLSHKWSECMPASRKFVAFISWLAACVLGSYIAMRYDFQPGALGKSQTQCADGSDLHPCMGQITVLAFLHPRCVCTAATVKQLIGAIHQQPQARLIAVLFVPPEPHDAEVWKDADYERYLRAHVPGVRIVFDPGGKEAERFGAITSGTLLVYDRQGQEIFRGGITGRRGGEEDNPGLRQFIQALTEDQRNGTPSRTSVFGCSLKAPPGCPPGDGVIP
jgi:hypothetical protein